MLPFSIGISFFSLSFLLLLFLQFSCFLIFDILPCFCLLTTFYFGLLLLIPLPSFCFLMAFCSLSPPFSFLKPVLGFLFPFYCFFRCSFPPPTPPLLFLSVTIPSPPSVSSPLELLLKSAHFILVTCSKTWMLCLFSGRITINMLHILMECIIYCLIDQYKPHSTIHTNEDPGHNRRANRIVFIE